MFKAQHVNISFFFSGEETELRTNYADADKKKKVDRIKSSLRAIHFQTQSIRCIRVLPLKYCNCKSIEHWKESHHRSWRPSRACFHGSSSCLSCSVRSPVGYQHRRQHTRHLTKKSALA